MGHHCEYVDRIEIEYDYETDRSFLVRYVNAKYKNNSLDVMMEYEPGITPNRFFYRNIEFFNMGGYLVTFPGEQERMRYCDGKRTVKLEDWEESIHEYNLWCSNKVTQYSINRVLEVYPDFKYVAKKIPNEISTKLLLEILYCWKEHPECEGLIAIGLYKIALNKSLYKLTLPKRKQVINFILKNKDNPKINMFWDGFKLKDIQTIHKYNMTLDEYYDYKEHSISYYVKSKNWYGGWCRCDVPTWRYLRKKFGTGENKKVPSDIVSYYFDYIDMATRVGHNMEDPYWRFPSDMYKQHDKVQEELKNVAQSAEGLVSDYFKAVMQPLAKKFDKEIDGYKIFIPTEYEQIQKQCDALFQCLIRNNFIYSVIQQNEILVFIWKNGKPHATAQVFYDKEVGQFYADERGHSTICPELSEEQAEHFQKVYLEEEKLVDEKEKKIYELWYEHNCKPDIAAYRAFYKWLDTFKPFKVKADKKKKYYKGFASVDKQGVYHTPYGNFSFEVGKTYATPFDDKTIAEKGGHGVVSTNMVFHFCDSITEISRHYNPTCYAEVEPVGIVVEHQGALLSNKIKIVRALSKKEVEQLKIMDANREALAKRIGAQKNE